MRQTFSDRDRVRDEYKERVFSDAMRDADLFMDEEASDPFVCEQDFGSSSFFSAAREHYLRALSLIPDARLSEGMFESLALEYAWTLKGLLQDES